MKFLPVYAQDQMKVNFTIPIGPNLNNPTLPSQIARSPLAKRFELPPTTMIGVVDKRRNTISLAPPLSELQPTPKRILHGRQKSMVEKPSFMIASPSLLNKTLHRAEGESPFVSNYHVPNRSHL